MICDNILFCSVITKLFLKWTTVTFYIHFLKFKSFYHSPWHMPTKLTSNFAALNFSNLKKNPASHPLQDPNRRTNKDTRYHNLTIDPVTAAPTMPPPPEVAGISAANSFFWENRHRIERKKKTSWRKSVLFRFNATSWFNQFVPHQTVSSCSNFWREGR